MKTYARVDAGAVQEIILPRTWGVDDPSEPPKFLAEDEQPIERRFTAEFVATLIDVSRVDPLPDCWWTFDGDSFQPPVIRQPTPEEILANNTANRDALLARATLPIAPLQDAVDLGDVTAAETALLEKWKQYRVAVNRVDLTLPEPTWPPQP